MYNSFKWNIFCKMGLYKTILEWSFQIVSPNNPDITIYDEWLAAYPDEATQKPK
jgi:hypothetical protein